MSDPVELPLEILLQHYGWASLAPVESESLGDSAYLNIEYMPEENCTLDSFVNHEHVTETTSEF